MKLRDLRFRAGYTQRAFAKLLDIDPAYLSTIENGHRPLTAKVRRKSAEVLRVKPEFIE